MPELSRHPGGGYAGPGFYLWLHCNVNRVDATSAISPCMSGSNAAAMSLTLSSLVGGARPAIAPAWVDVAGIYDGAGIKTNSTDHPCYYFPPP